MRRDPCVGMSATYSVMVVLFSLAVRVTAAATPLLELHLLPHTHADVGWLMTPGDLARVNVTRILDGVVGNLANDTQKRRRFVWDEMYFLEWWWTQKATPAQQALFRAFVADGRIELVDNGWSQHDMGCTTYDSMLNNWIEGHLWIRETFGASARPRVGWSLDPFGLSSTQAVLQSLMGFDGWFFTRVPGSVVDHGKKNKSLEFIWRGSSSLPHEQTQIFSHIFESYYCMPLPTYAFEWGEAKGAEIPNATNILRLAENLANITKERSAWFRSNNVLIPWGCDYQYQNAALMFRSTDMIIDTINAHPEWGVHVQYTTATEYMLTLQATGVPLPVKEDFQSFFPYNSWSGYFTSRPNLKDISQRAHGPLAAAEALYALRGHAVTNPTRQQALWALLEEGRRSAGIVQHHDAITGTECSAKEGCAGVDQVLGAHNVLEVYEQLVRTTDANAKAVVAEVLSAETGLNLTSDVSSMGHALMDSRPVTLIVYNPLSSNRVEMISTQVPLCKVLVYDSGGTPVASQVTAQFTINDGLPPYYDFDLHFEVSLPPLSYVSFTLIADGGGCGGGDLAAISVDESGATKATTTATKTTTTAAAKRAAEAVGSSTFTRHVPTWPPSARSSFATSAFDSLLRALQAEQMAMTHAASSSLSQTSGGRTTLSTAGTQSDEPAVVVMENAFLKVYVNVTYGIQSIYDKGTRRNYSLTHTLMKYDSGINDAYDFKPISQATPVGAQGKPTLAGHQCFAASCTNTSRALSTKASATSKEERCTFTMLPQSDCATRAKCLGWKRTGGCDPLGPREPEHDRGCDDLVVAEQSGYCSCDGNRSYPFACDATTQRPGFTCADVCGSGGPVPLLLASSVTLGPIMQEVRLQAGIEHKTRIRLWRTDDPTLGGRLELAHTIGTLEQRTELLSRFELAELRNSSSTFFTEDNGYEPIKHAPGNGSPRVDVGDIPLQTFPSQMSTWLTDTQSDVQLSIALARSHGVASLSNSTIDIMQHRRGAPFSGSGSTVVIDDTDRTFSETWLSVGNVSRSNELRHANKLRLNHPPLLLFDTAGTKATPLLHPLQRTVARTPTDPLAAQIADLPTNVLLQNVRATSANRSELMLTLLHVFGSNEQPAASSRPTPLDLTSIINPFRPELQLYTETILNGLLPKAQLTRLKWNVTNAASATHVSKLGASELAVDAQLTLRPFEFRTFLVKA